MNVKLLDRLVEESIVENYNSHESVPTVEVDHRRLVELVVRECMVVARSRRDPQNLNYKPSQRFVEDLKQHFGIVG